MVTKILRNTFPIVIAVLTLSLAACAPKSPSGMSPEAQVSAEHIWQKYNQSGEASLGSFRNSLSLRYGEEGKTQRVNALLWGNNAREIRLDANAGVGITVAKIYEGPSTFMVYAPQENTAYYHEGKQKPLFSVGVPMPLGLSHLTRLLEGQYSQVLGQKHIGTVTPPSADASLLAKDIPKGAMQYTLSEGPFQGTLVLNTDGLPLYWREAVANSQGWSILFSYRDGDTKPYRLRIRHGATGKQALLLVKERSLQDTPFTDVQMRLTLPEDVRVLPLEELHNT